MRTKTILIFGAAVAVCLVAAAYRFGDSGHAVGMLSTQGGKVRHGVHLDPGKRQYVVIVGGTVMPPYRGNARVTVEGQPEMDCQIHYSGPVIDLGLHRKPAFEENTLVGLQPKDRFTLWVVMRPRTPDWSRPQMHSLKNTVTFRDTATGKTLLQIPVVYEPEKECCHAEAD